jgi:flagellar biosynthesis protein FlhA
MAADLGYVLPPVRVTDNLNLKAREYSVVLKGTEIGRAELPPGCDLAIPPAGGSVPVPGTPTREPAFGIPAQWIPSEQSDAARQAGCTVVDPASVLGTHLSELARRHCHEIFSRQDAKRFLDRVAEDHPRAVEDLVPKLLPMSTVQRVLQNLLRERVPLRDAAGIVESLGEAATVTRNPVLLTEFVRQAQRRAIVKPHLNSAGELAAFFLDADCERAIEQAVEHGDTASHLNLAPQRVGQILEAVRPAVSADNAGPVILASSGARFFLRQLLEGQFPQVTVLAHGEVPPGVKVVAAGLLRGNQTA